jgi:hypothetical protein
MGKFWSPAPRWVICFHCQPEVTGCPHGGGSVHVVATIKLMGAEPLIEPGVVPLREQLPACVQGSPIPEPPFHRLVLPLGHHPKPFKGIFGQLVGFCK